MSTDTFRMDSTLPTLVIPAPQCGHCGSDVEMDGDAAWCSNCLVEWGRIEDGQVATPDADREGTDVPCEIGNPHPQDPAYTRARRRYELGEYEPCVLPSGHGGHHLHPYTVTVTEEAA